jgi:hypothetical protein
LTPAFAGLLPATSLALIAAKDNMGNNNNGLMQTILGQSGEHQPLALTSWGLHYLIGRPFQSG